MAARSDNKMERVLEKVQLLIARADHPNTPPEEADTARKMADALMFRYKIESLSAPEATGIEPVWGRILVCEMNNEFSNYYVGIVRTIARHNGVLLHMTYERAGDKGFNYYVANVVGFEGDVRYTEMLVTSALLAFGRMLEPKVHPEETDAANALRLRQGGMERRRIALALFGSWTTENEMKAKNRKVTRLIKEEAQRIGQPELEKALLGRGNNIKTYRDSYANGFYWTLNSRIQMLATERAQSGEGTLVLHSMKERIEEALYTRYPNLRPRKDEAQIAGASGHSNKDCEKCAKAKSGYCREHSWMKPSTAKAKHRAFNEKAYYAGGDAARTVDLGPGGRGSIGN